MLEGYLRVDKDGRLWLELTANGQVSVEVTETQFITLSELLKVYVD
jgi:hypothetical protein